jgi:hypothetical protein
MMKWLVGGAFFILAAVPAAAQTSHDWFPGGSGISEPEIIPPAFRGRWAPDVAGCRDEDGVSGVTVFADGVETYETGGRLERVTQAGQERSIRVKLAYEGEGEFWDSIETWTLDASFDRLTIDDSGEQDPSVMIRCD